LAGLSRKQRIQELELITRVLRGANPNGLWFAPAFQNYKKKKKIPD
jgi:hypothetical protein